MKIGILTCGYVDPPLSDGYGQYADMIERSMSVVNQSLSFENYDAIKGDLPSLDDCDGFILTGSVHNAYDDDPWIVDLAEWIRRCETRRKPLVGICFGHQLIARALGGKVVKSEKGWGLGSYAVNVIEQKRWMKLAIDSVRLLVSHQDQVVILPSGMRVIAHNEFCPNFMLAKDNHIFTVQGHPEFSVDFTARLVEKRKSIISDSHYRSAYEELDKTQDSALICHWIDEFFVYNQQHQDENRYSQVG